MYVVPKGPFKNQVTAIEGGVEDFVTYCYVCFEAEGVCYVIVMVDSKFENS